MAQTQIFPFANVIVGFLVLILGSVFHWLGQLISLVNWDFAARLGIAEKEICPEFKAYELGFATTDVLLGWIYGIAAVGLILDLVWAYELIWIPAVIFVYHGLSFWFYIGNQHELGKSTASRSLRIGWTIFNVGTGFLSILVALSN